MTSADSRSDRLPLVAVTCGDVAGIGPEIVARAVASGELTAACRVLLLGHPRILQSAAELAGVRLPLQQLEELPATAQELQQCVATAAAAGHSLCWNPAGDGPLAAPLSEVSAAAGEAAYRWLVAATQLALSGCVDAIATAPLNKEGLHRAGHQFPGHTEILAEQCGVQQFAMMLYLPESRLTRLRQLLQTPGAVQPGAAAASDCGLSIAHVTLHTSIASVPQLLHSAGILEKTQLIHDFLTQIGCQRRAIAVCALNPHGGEHGLFGDEEQRIIQPAVDQARAEGLHAVGPLPVDTLMRRALAGEFDGVVAMYHDQGHIPVKLIGFDAAVNITLGLPIVRTSPTHGTAFDRAWNPAAPADPSGMLEAIRMAARLSHSRPQPRNTIAPIRTIPKV